MERCGTPDSLVEEQIDVTTISPVKCSSPAPSDCCSVSSSRALDLTSVTSSQNQSTEAPKLHTPSQAFLSQMYSPGVPLQSTPVRPMPAYIPPHLAVTHVQEMARQQHLQLQHELANLQQQQHLTVAIQHLHQEYMAAVNQIETNRYQTLIYNIGNELCKQMTNSYYDHEWMMVIQRTRQQAATIQFSSGQTPVKQETTSTKLPMYQPSSGQLPSTLSTTSQFASAHALYQLSTSVPNVHQPMTPTRLLPNQTSPGSSPSTDSPLPNSDTSSYNSSSSSSPATTDSASSDSSTPPMLEGRRRYLNPKAVMILTDWYCQHFDHPYPTEDDLHRLAAAGGITIAQVKKWMANKRVQSYNTLAFNGSIHPKKLERLQRENIARARVGLPLEVPTKTKPTNQRKPNTRLTTEAQQVLNEWYKEHSSHPYPTEEEKEMLAEKGGLSIKQIKYWFANKRSRSSNGKKDRKSMSPINSYQPVLLNQLPLGHTGLHM